MILWVILFALIVSLSFILALKSMSDYHLIPAQTKDQYGLFLIRKIQELNRHLLLSLHKHLLISNLHISFERLIKGNKAALVVFGPKRILSNYQMQLDLLELEDYTNINGQYFGASEFAVEKVSKMGFPSLPEDDQMWWQLILSASKDSKFHPHIRLVVISPHPKSKDKILAKLVNHTKKNYLKQTNGFSEEEVIDHFKQRGFRKITESKPLNPEEIISLLQI